MNETNLEGDRQTSDPTQDQIRRRAGAIRRHWSTNVAARRRVTPKAAWRPPLVLTVDLVREINSRNE
jgi:hypothetical protein